MVKALTTGWLIGFLLAWPIAAPAQAIITKNRFAFQAAAGAAYPGFTYDIVEDFENALAGLWTEVDASSILNPQDTAAEYTSNGGAQGMSIASGSTAAAYIVYTPGAPLTTISVGFWYKTPAINNFDGKREICTVFSDSFGNVMRIREGDDAGDGDREFAWDLDGDVVASAADTWYWVTCKFIKNGACSYAIYNTSFAQVGSTGAATDPNNSNLDNLRIGSVAVGVSGTTAAYFDEIYFDTTDQTFPLGPAQ